MDYRGKEWYLAICLDVKTNKIPRVGLTGMEVMRCGWKRWHASDRGVKIGGGEGIWMFHSSMNIEQGFDSSTRTELPLFAHIKIWLRAHSISPKKIWRAEKLTANHPSFCYTRIWETFHNRHLLRRTQFGRDQEISVRTASGYIPLPLTMNRLQERTEINTGHTFAIYPSASELSLTSESRHLQLSCSYE